MEIIILLFNSFCILTFEQQDDENREMIESMFKSTLKLLLRDVDATRRPFILENLTKYKKYERFRELTSAVFYEHECLRNEWKAHCDVEYNPPNSVEWKEQLMQTTYFEYSHKCLRTTSSDVHLESSGKIKSAQSNFDLGDFLFDEQSDEEPSRKKAKLCLNDLESLVERLENDTELLSHVNTFSNEHKIRIDNVIHKLRNILS